VGGIWGQTRNLEDRTFDPADLTRRRSDGPGRRGFQIWGQTRCPVYRSGTLNVQRSTLNFQLGDRKGAWRGGIWGQTRNLDGRTFDRAGLPKRRLIGRGRLRHPDMGTDTMSGTRYGDRHDVRYTD